MLFALIGLLSASGALVFLSLDFGKVMFAHQGNPTWKTLAQLPMWAVFAFCFTRVFPGAAASKFLPYLSASCSVPFWILGYWQGLGKLAEPVTVNPRDLIWVLRLPVVVFAVLVLLASFCLQGHSLAAYGWEKLMPLSLVVACGVALAMVCNDWSDRFHDRQKGKWSAFNNPDLYERYGMSIGLLLACFIGMVSDNPKWLWPCMFLLVTSIQYTQTYRVPFLSNLLVAVTSAVPTLFCLTDPLCQNTGRAWMLFGLVTIVIFAREILKDIEDMHIDSGYKWSVPVTWGDAFARKIAGLLLGLSCIFLVGLSVSLAVTLVSIGLLILASVVTIRGISPGRCKALVDLGILAFLVPILFVPNAL